jgi:AraC-like DNA-binding protein
MELVSIAAPGDILSRQAREAPGQHTMLSTSGPYCIFIHGADDTNRPNGWSLPQRCLTYYLLVCSLSGEEQIVVSGKRYVIPPRSCYLIAPGLISDLGSKRGSRPGWIHFDVAWNPDRAAAPHAGPYSAELKERVKYLQPSPIEVWGVDLPVLVPVHLKVVFTEAISRIIALIKRSDRLAYLEATTTLSNLMLTWVASEWKRKNPSSGFDYESRFARAELQARQSLGTGFSVSDFARAAHLSRSQFTVLYTKVKGVTPGHFLRQERLRQAEALLARSDLPLAAIGAMVGYPDASVFGRVFRAAHGVSPKTWRAEKG